MKIMPDFLFSLILNARIFEVMQTIKCTTNNYADFFIFQITINVLTLLQQFLKKNATTNIVSKN